MNKGYILAIDGPVASGKGTLAVMLAEKLSAFYMNTGAMYRAVALKCIENNVNVENVKEVESVLSNLEFEFRRDEVFLNGDNISGKIKSPEVANKSSVVATYQTVRDYLVDIQQKLGLFEAKKGKIVIAEGRDIGTKVFPNAEVKIFLVADSKVRARRRFEQFKEKGINISLDDVLSDIEKRDHNDKNRKVSPLVSAEDSVRVDTTNDSIDDTYNKVIDIIKKKGLYD